METRVRTQLVQTFLSALREEQLPWRRCWTTVQPTSFSTGKPYRGINNLLLSHVANERGYEDPRWMTYHQAQANGWQVRKGEKSVPVEYWHSYDTKLKIKLDRSEVIRIQREEPERMKDIKFTAFWANVFNAQQIDGVPAWVPPRSEVHPELLLYRREQRPPVL